MRNRGSAGAERGAASTERNDVEHFGKRVPAVVAREPLFDPGMTRLRVRLTVPDGERAGNRRPAKPDETKGRTMRSGHAVL
jgi:hypothetical protein